jgi:transcriptional regulator with XRE-family HTH domain
MFEFMASRTSVGLSREEQEALEFQRQVGRSVRYWRMQRTLTPEEFARRSGKPVAVINEIESGEAMPGVEFLWRAGQVLNVSCLAFTAPPEHRSAA